MNNIIGYIHGTGGLDQNYTTSILTNTNYLPVDIYDVYMGNNYLMNTGVVNALIKDVKVWGYART